MAPPNVAVPVNVGSIVTLPVPLQMPEPVKLPSPLIVRPNPLVARAGSVNSVVDQILAFRETVGDFGTLLYCGHDWADPRLARRSMELMAEKVMPAVNAGRARKAGARKDMVWGCGGVGVTYKPTHSPTPISLAVFA